MPEKLWTEVCNTVQEVVTKTIPKKKKGNEALQIAEKRSEVKGKGERERYAHLNAELKRKGWREKVFLSEQCKEIEENNRVRKTRDFF